VTAIPARKETATQLPGRRESRAADRYAGLVEGWLKGHTILVYAFLYLPIVIVVLFAFNDTTRRVTAWDGFSTKWFGVALTDTVVQKALLNSFLVAVPNAIMATVFGTMAALGLQRVGKKTRIFFGSPRSAEILRGMLAGFHKSDAYSTGSPGRDQEPRDLTVSRVRPRFVSRKSMNRWSPPRRSIRSWPGRRYRW
jgi:hypothetical protein